MSWVSYTVGEPEQGYRRGIGICPYRGLGIIRQIGQVFHALSARGKARLIGPTTMDANGSSLSVAQRVTPKASPFRTPSRNRAKPSGPAPGAAAGFLLLDSSLRPLSFNTEAIRVLGYPDTPANVRRPDVFLAGKIRARLMSEPASRESPLVAEFRSGRRRYSCRAFLVDAYANGSSHARIAVLLERSPSGLIPLLGP